MYFISVHGQDLVLLSLIIIVIFVHIPLSLLI